MKKASPRQKSMDRVLSVIQRWPTNHPSIANLAATTKLSPRTVQYLLRAAEKAGLVRISYSTGRGLANCYEVLVKVPERVQRKGASLHPLRSSTSYSYSLRRQPGQSSTDPARRRPAVEADSTPLDEPPWWMLRVGTARGDEEWPRDAEGRRLALLEGKCFICGQPLIRYSDGEVTPPKGVLVRFPDASRDVPIHMPGGCPGSRGEGYRTVGDIAQDQQRRHLRVV